jgi:V/A-type H+-transporting ATPase subunit E
LEAQSLLKEVEERKNREIAKLEEEFKARMDELKKKRDEEVSRIIDEARREAAQKAQRESTKALGLAQLEAKKIVMKALEDFLERAMDEIKRYIAEYTQTKEYKKLLTEMYEYAKKRLGTRVVVHCRKEDKAVFEALGAKVSTNYVQGLGGAIFESEDGSVELDMTFEELIRLKEDKIKAQILKSE